MPVPLQRSMDAVPAAVPALRRAVAEFVAQAGLGETLLTPVKLAVSEAVTNAVVHAYVGAPAPGAVRVAAWFEDDSLLVEVSDDGSGMAPRTDSPGLGVGLPCIASATDALDISSSPRGGAQLRMAFRIAEVASARA